MQSKPLQRNYLTVCAFLLKIYSGQPHEKKQIIDIDFYFHFHFFLSEFSVGSRILRDVVLLFPIGCRGLLIESWIPVDDWCLLPWSGFITIYACMMFVLCATFGKKQILSL